jgi:endo-1,4-beta-xylanase
MRNFCLSTLALSLHLASGTKDNNITLREAASRRGIFAGAAVNVFHLGDDAPYKALAQAQYNLVTAENACKWGETEHQQGKFNFSQCDAIRDFALETMKGVFRGHNLCWGNNNPGWLKSLNATAKQAALVNHIQRVAKHYGSDAFAWDVVNEAVTDDHDASDPLKKTDWYPDVPNYIDVAFTTARTAFPQSVKLFYNDYNIASSTGWSSVKSDRVYNLVKGMMDRKVPIDGVGFQMHIKDTFDDFAGVQANMERLGALGLDVHITELDVSFSSWSQSSEQTQAHIYADLLKVCLAVPACKNFETWGLTDKYTWIQGNKHPLPFDKNLKPKAAVSSMIEILLASSTTSPTPTPPRHPRKYERLTLVCENQVPISGKLLVGSVAQCERMCDEHSTCTGMDSDGSQCFLKSHCEGTVGGCSGLCGYRVKSDVSTLIV